MNGDETVLRSGVRNEICPHCGELDRLDLVRSTHRVGAAHVLGVLLFGLLGLLLVMSSSGAKYVRCRNCGGSFARLPGRLSFVLRWTFAILAYGLIGWMLWGLSVALGLAPPQSLVDGVAAVGAWVAANPAAAACIMLGLFVAMLGVMATAAITIHRVHASTVRAARKAAGKPERMDVPPHPVEPVAATRPVGG